MAKYYDNWKKTLEFCRKNCQISTVRGMAPEQLYLCPETGGTLKIFWCLEEIDYFEKFLQCLHRFPFASPICGIL